MKVLLSEDTQILCERCWSFAVKSLQYPGFLKRAEYLEWPLQRDGAFRAHSDGRVNVHGQTSFHGIESHVTFTSFPAVKGTCLEVLRTRCHDDCHVVFRFIPVSPFFSVLAIINCCQHAAFTVFHPRGTRPSFWCT